MVSEAVYKNVSSETIGQGTASMALWALPQSRDVILLAEALSPAPIKVDTDAAGNRFAEFDISGLAPGAEITVRQEYRLRIWGYGGEGGDGPILPAHTMPGARIESDAAEIVRLAERLTAGKPSTEAKLAAIFEGTRQRLTYNLASPARNKGALAALLAGSGVCEEFASLFVALARAAGIPSRLVIGYGRSASSLEGAWAANRDSIGRYRHAWAEAYVPGYGWAAFDPTLNRAAIPGVAAARIPAGILLAETYQNRTASTVYVGGRLQTTWRRSIRW